MAFKDYSLAPADNTALGDGTYIGPNMLRNKVRPALQQIAADGKDLADKVDALADGAVVSTLRPELAAPDGASLVGFSEGEAYDAGTVGARLDQMAFITAEGSSLIATVNGVRYTLNMTAEAGVLFRRPVFGWNSTASIDTARFASSCEITPTTGLFAYSTRHTAAGGDGEIGMRLEVRPYTLNVAAETLTPGTPVVVDTPATWTSGTGAVWAGQLLRLPTGRILLIAQFLNSPDGTYTHADSRYDLVLYYSDDNGATWSAKQTILAGQGAHLAFGLADNNNPAAGFQLAGGNNLAIRLDSGRIVVVGFLAGSPNYLASIYTDSSTGITGWTAGTPIQYTDADWNEVSVAGTDDGLFAFVRDEGANDRVIYRSTDGASWTFDRLAADLPIRNVASAAHQSGARIVVAGATTVGDNRLGYKAYNSTNGAATFTEGAQIFNPKARIGYAHLNRLSTGYYLLSYEVTSAQAPNSFNSKGGVGALLFNAAKLEGSPPAVVPPPDSEVYVAATEYATYAAYVAAQGGTISDTAATQAAIAAAIAGNYWSGLAFAVGGPFGNKIAGLATDKLLSLNSTFGDTVGQVASISLDTTTYPHDTISMPAGAFVDFDNVVLRDGNVMGAVMLDSGGSDGSLKWTQTVDHYIFPRTFQVDATQYIAGSPNYQIDAGEVSSYVIDFAERSIEHGQDGVSMQQAEYFPDYGSAGASTTVRLLYGTGTKWAEVWVFNNATPEAIRQCAIDVAARY